MAFLTGIVSVTFRQCTPEEIIRRCKAAGLDGIEWGSDVHIKAGETAYAAEIAGKCKSEGLKIHSYGSYWKGLEAEGFEEIVETAAALKAPNIRIWAGAKNSEDVSGDERKILISNFQYAADLAKEHKMTISFEYHGGTLTNNADSAIQMIKEIDRDNVTLYWQPNQFKDIEFNLEALKKVLPYVSNIHVFNWNGGKKLPLADGRDQWERYIDILRRDGKLHGMFLEFVPDDLEENLYSSSETLKDFLDADILHQIKSMKFDIPYDTDTSILSTPLQVKGENFTLKNRLTYHPMEGFDSSEDGSPGELTERRYRRFAKSGASLVWIEAVAVQEDARTSRRQLWITKDNLDSYKRLADMIHSESNGVPIILQLTHSGRFSKPSNKPAPVISYHNPILNRAFDIPADYPVVTDDYLDRLGEKFIEAAGLAKEAGFDGVDVKACHRYLLSELLSAFTREGKYGGSYENRTRLFKDIISGIKAKYGSELAVASRFNLYDSIDYPYGFGVDKENYRKPDFTETIKLLGEINALGVNLIDITMGTPYFNPHVNRPYSRGGYIPPELPLEGVERLIQGTGIVQKALPDMTFIGTGYSFLGEYAAAVAAGAINNGLVKAAGFGRMAFAYENLVNDILSDNYDRKKACITCGKCTEIMRANGTTGCPVRDSEVYAPIYKKYCMK